MMKFLLCFVLIATSILHADQEGEVVVHNRILSKVMGKTISVLDVMKKMDLYLDRYYPQYAASKEAKIQFYNTQWRSTLEQLIDNELILADAAEKEIKTTDGDVREEIQTRFGPNVMGTLDKIGITYEEARSMIHDELIVQKMTWFKIHSKALANVNSKDVKKAYTEFCSHNPPKETWTYQVISIRAPQNFDAEEIGKKFYDCLLSEKRELSEIAANFKATENLDPAISISISQDYITENKDLSSSHQSILTSIQNGNFSFPVLQQSRADNTNVVRIFHRKNHNAATAPLFQRVANTIKDELLQVEVNKESSRYMKKLRLRYGYDQQFWNDHIPPNFQPFSLN